MSMAKSKKHQPQHVAPPTASDIEEPEANPIEDVEAAIERVIIEAIDHIEIAVPVGVVVGPYCTNHSNVKGMSRLAAWNLARVMMGCMAEGSKLENGTLVNDPQRALKYILESLGGTVPDGLTFQ